MIHTVLVRDLALLDAVDQGVRDVPRAVVDHIHRGVGRAVGTTIVGQTDAHALP